jgi:hypothetical protein
VNRKVKSLLVLPIVAASLSACAQKPKDSYVDRVRNLCGDEIADLYKDTKWRDRDYAQDSLLVTCIAFRTAGSPSEFAAAQQTSPRRVIQRPPVRGSRSPGGIRARGGR